MWDERYSESHYIYGTSPNDFLKEHLSELPKGKVLCLADGEGRNSVFLAENGFEVTAVDSSSVGLEKGKKLAQERGVVINHIHADLAEYDLGLDQWDAIVSIFCHVPPPIRGPLHQHIVKALKKGGVLLLEAYTPEQLKFGTGGPPDPALTMSATLLKQELTGLTIKHLEELERDVVEGTHHTGRGAVVQCIACKD
ncbi:MAG: class I SAM-dependent methyltransferase [Gammaproteobacteria bacterium]|nr:class I SAM-dependent methyltransferase [Gammaproteobacteria bacterium]MDH5693537.1 class I SAM-dependent methyltransferase [Gammaproteobacteria bacterium]